MRSGSELLASDLLQRYRPHGGPPASNDDFDNPSRSPRDRTRREDRHLNLYELWDRHLNLYELWDNLERR
jgi:hypothetical protein